MSPQMNFAWQTSFLSPLPAWATSPWQLHLMGEPAGWHCSPVPSYRLFYLFTSFFYLYFFQTGIKYPFLSPGTQLICSFYCLLVLETLNIPKQFSNQKPTERGLVKLDCRPLVIPSFGYGYIYSDKNKNYARSANAIKEAI